MWSCGVVELWSCLSFSPQFVLKFVDVHVGMSDGSFDIFSTSATTENLFRWGQIL
jgi:hypothetical protein